MRKKKDVFDVKLDAEEKRMLASLENGEWRMETCTKNKGDEKKCATGSCQLFA
jgi:hypothetical protein